MKEYTEQPLFFNPNRVYRVYTGGRLMDQFLGGEGSDNHFPEEWIASTVHAVNDIETGVDEGLSKIEHTEITLKELGDRYPKETYGPAGSLNILVKYLDSAIRLPIQAHPDQAFSRTYFHSEFGKTEMWLVLAIREGANICFGFKDKMTKKQFSALETRSRTEKNVMDEYLNRVYVKPGEVYLIPAKAVHAIGAGCLILEVQEPTDFTLSPEFWCGDHLLSDREMYLGLTKEEALDCFDYSIYGTECIRLSKKTPKLVEDTPQVKVESLITEEDTPCFKVLRSRVKSRQVIKNGSAIYIVTKGKGCIDGSHYHREIKQGDYFFMPYEAKEKFTVLSQEDSGIEIIACIPPEKSKDIK